MTTSSNLCYLIVDRTASFQLGSSWRIIHHISRNEGGLFAFYRGLAPNLVGNSTSWALYFLFYGRLKDAIGSFHGSSSTLTLSDYFVASGTAGMYNLYSQ